MIRKKQKIDESEVMKFGFLGGIAQSVYTLLVVLLMTVLGKAMPESVMNTIMGPLMFLLLFVFSAGVSGVLVFGYPAYLAFQKRYVEGLMTVVTTFLTLAIVWILVFMWASVI